MIKGIEHVLVHRSKEKADWSPASLSDPAISEEKIEETFFDRTKSPAKDAPVIEIPGGTPASSKAADSTWGVFRAWGLPSEQTIKEYVEGSAKTSGAFALTQEELQERLLGDLAAKIDVSLEDLGQFKLGVLDKVRDVVSRKCTTVNEAGVAYLKWKSSKA
jgi:3-hydroxyisobutyryl-CoA hydrolase